jgi:formylglycine-generating enzyme required for sulfatase activity
MKNTHSREFRRISAKLLFCLFAVTLALFTACPAEPGGGKKDDPETPSTGKDEIVTITDIAAGTLKGVAIGDTVPLSDFLAITPASGNNFTSIDWAISDDKNGFPYYGPGTSSFATISSANRTITGTAAGKTYVKATAYLPGSSSPKQVILEISVYTGFDSLTLAQTSSTVAQGKAVIITPVVSPSNADMSMISYTSNNRTVAAVGGPGVIYAINPGTAVITVAAGKKSAQYTLTVTSIGQFIMETIQVNPGTFNYGERFETDNTSSYYSKPIITLTKGFRMGKYPVTQAQYVIVMGSNPSYFAPSGEKAEKVAAMDTSDFPVENVNFYMAIEFCNRLSLKEGLQPVYFVNNTSDPDQWPPIPAGDWENQNSVWKNFYSVDINTGYRLPYDYQWEYACRAGTTTAFNWNSNTISTARANYNGNTPGTTENITDSGGSTLGRTSAVGSYSANNWGFYDFHGNVYEITGKHLADDIWNTTTDVARRFTDPPVSMNGFAKNLGGDYNDNGFRARSAGIYGVMGAGTRERSALYSRNAKDTDIDEFKIWARGFRVLKP